MTTKIEINITEDIDAKELLKFCDKLKKFLNKHKYMVKDVKMAINPCYLYKNKRK